MKIFDQVIVYGVVMFRIYSGSSVVLVFFVSIWSSNSIEFLQALSRKIYGSFFLVTLVEHHVLRMANFKDLNNLCSVGAPTDFSNTKQSFTFIFFLFKFHRILIHGIPIRVCSLVYGYSLHFRPLIKSSLLYKANY